MKNKKHSFEFKMAVVQSYLNNEGGYKALAKQYQFNPSLITRWVNNYNEFGPDSLLKHMTKTTYTSEFKRSVLDYRQENLLSYKDTAHHFGIR
ncbi:helix-turn-helix domain-containing protein, partial [Jeotgalicoccus psychrophilus]|uniref:helix-turn-helix domain-containing protein n=1 Tax=Jeotgalicoccus psychrophilus TaxID=157228 RepID=UPI00047A114A